MSVLRLFPTARAHAPALLLLSLAGLGACADGPPADEPLAAEARIVAAAGGVVATDDGSVRLTVPAGSLSADETISIHAVRELPVGELGGLRPAGPAYRFGPAGTQFSLSDASGMVVRYDREQVIADGLDPRSVQLHYFDEDSGRWIAVAGRVDAERAEVFGRIEHFTVYLPMARALVPGNNPPAVSLQSTLPTAARAGAPLAIRATVRDLDAGGSVAGAVLTYTVAGRAAVNVAMTADATIGALDTYQAIIPATDVITGPGTDLTYSITATDNLGATTTTVSAALDVTRTADLATLAANPPSQTMAAGFSRYFTWSLRDDQGTQFNVLPERVEVLGAVGEVVATGSSGVGLRARKAGAGGLRGTIGNATASAQVAVTNGPLDSIEILDGNGLPILGTFEAREGHGYRFDAVGHDAYGNRVLVLPTWSCDPAVGGIDGDGVLDTLDGHDIGRVRATVGTVSDSQWVRVRPRALLLRTDAIEAAGVIDPRGLVFVDGQPLVTGRFNQSIVHAFGLSPALLQWELRASLDADILRVATDGTTTYYALAAPGAPVVRVFRHGPADFGVVLLGTVYVGANGWIEDLSLAVAPDGTPWVAYAALSFPPGVTRTVVTRYHDGAWIEANATANLDPQRTADRVRLAFDGSGAPLLATRELDAAGQARAYVKRWTGDDWAVLGGPITSPTEVAGTPELAVSAAGNLYVAIATDRLRLRLVSWSGGAWTPVMAPYQATFVGDTVSMALVGELPYLGVARSEGPVIVPALLRPRRDRTDWVDDRLGVDFGDSPGLTTALAARPDGSLWLAHSTFVIGPDQVYAGVFVLE